MRISDWSSDVCSSDLRPESAGQVTLASADPRAAPLIDPAFLTDDRDMAVLKAGVRQMYRILETPPLADHQGRDRYPIDLADDAALEQPIRRSEEHTSELQSLMRNSYDFFRLKKKTNTTP